MGGESGKTINEMSKVTIIAEAGVNHNGDIELAKKLIDVAAEAGADYVKFQTFRADKIVSRVAEKAEYQKRNSEEKASETQFDMLQKLELSEKEHQILVDHCKKAGIRFLSTAFDLESIDVLGQFNLDFFKVPSGEITNLPYLRKISKLKVPVVLSTGMADKSEIEAAVNVLTEAGVEREKLTVLHCTTEYPTEYSDVNLNAMLDIQRSLKVHVGYSDHTLGIEVPFAAVALGARVIEKHFTLDRKMTGPDHAASLEPRELKAMVKGIRNIELAMLGDGIKKPRPVEEKNKLIARKSIHLQRDIEAGQIITEGMLIAIRPGDGISPMEWDKLVGLTANVSIKAGSKLSWTDFK